MKSEDLERLRAHYDNTDTSDGWAAAALDESVDPDPMVGITVRLPARVLNAARGQAEADGRKVTALLRTWIEQAVAAGTHEQAYMKSSDLLRLIAEAAPGPRIILGPDMNNVLHGSFGKTPRHAMTPRHMRSVNS